MHIFRWNYQLFSAAYAVRRVYDDHHIVTWRSSLKRHYLQADKEDEEEMTLLAPVPDRRKSSILSVTRRAWMIDHDD